MTEINWQAVAVFASISMAFLSLLFGVLKWIGSRLIQQIDKRFDALNEDRAREMERIAGVERDLLALEKQLPLEYLRREDWIRHVAVQDLKLDRIHERIDVLVKEVRNDN